VTAINQPELHPLYRRWRALGDEYPGDRVFVGEIVLKDQEAVAQYVRPDELQLAFNFTLLHEPWDAASMRETIDRTRLAVDAVGAPATWVLENHDVVRVPTRYGGGEEGDRRARAAALMLLALPGTAFVYAGQELGLEEVALPDELRQDPIFFRTNGERIGRDGTRIPMPWKPEPPRFGFTTAEPWLPIPEEWVDKSVAAQEKDDDSMLGLYRRALALRRESEALRGGSFAWQESPPGSLVFARASDDDVVICAVNVDAAPFELPAGEVLLTSEPVRDRRLTANAAAWIRPT
jgi:alpha-glucosidase